MGKWIKTVRNIFKKKAVLQAEGHYDTDKSADGTTDLSLIGVAR